MTLLTITMSICSGLAVTLKAMFLPATNHLLAPNYRIVS